MSSEAFNIRETRIFRNGFGQQDPVQWLLSWLETQKFACKVYRKSQTTTINAHKSGIHVNFEPILTAVFGNIAPNSPVQLSVHYFAKMKVASGIAVGIMTGGISAIVGVGTLSAHAADAKDFINHLWNTMSGIAVSPPEIVTGELEGKSKAQTMPTAQPQMGQQQFYQQQQQPYQQQQQQRRELSAPVQQWSQTRPNIKELENNDLEGYLQHLRLMSRDAKMELKNRRQGQFQQQQQQQKFVPQGSEQGQFRPEERIQAFPSANPPPILPFQQTRKEQPLLSQQTEGIQPHRWEDQPRREPIAPLPSQSTQSPLSTESPIAHAESPIEERLLQKKKVAAVEISGPGRESSQSRPTPEIPVVPSAETRHEAWKETESDRDRKRDVTKGKDVDRDRDRDRGKDVYLGREVLAGKEGVDRDRDRNRDKDWGQQEGGYQGGQFVGGRNLPYPGDTTSQNVNVPLREGQWQGQREGQLGQREGLLGQQEGQRYQEFHPTQPEHLTQVKPSGYQAPIGAAEAALLAHRQGGQLSGQSQLPGQSFQQGQPIIPGQEQQGQQNLPGQLGQPGQIGGQTFQPGQIIGQPGQEQQNLSQSQFPTARSQASQYTPPMHSTVGQMLTSQGQQSLTGQQQGQQYIPGQEQQQVVPGQLQQGQTPGQLVGQQSESIPPSSIPPSSSEFTGPSTITASEREGGGNIGSSGGSSSGTALTGTSSGGATSGKSRIGGLFSHPVRAMKAMLSKEGTKEKEVTSEYKEGQPQGTTIGGGQLGGQQGEQQSTGQLMEQSGQVPPLTGEMLEQKPGQSGQQFGQQGEQIGQQQFGQQIGQQFGQQQVEPGDRLPTTTSTSSNILPSTVGKTEFYQPGEKEKFLGQQGDQPLGAMGGNVPEMFANQPEEYGKLQQGQQQYLGQQQMGQPILGQQQMGQQGYAQQPQYLEHETVEKKRFPLTEQGASVLPSERYAKFAEKVSGAEEQRGSGHI